MSGCRKPGQWCWESGGGSITAFFSFHHYYGSGDMHRKAALGNVHKKEDTCGIPELKPCQTVTTHEILVKHLVLLTTFIELGCNAVILFFLGVCVHICMTKSNSVSLIVTASELFCWCAAVLGKRQKCVVPISPHGEHFWTNPKCGTLCIVSFMLNVGSKVTAQRQDYQSLSSKTRLAKWQFWRWGMMIR